MFCELLPTNSRSGLSCRLSPPVADQIVYTGRDPSSPGLVGDCRALAALIAAVAWPAAREDLADHAAGQAVTLSPLPQWSILCWLL